MDTYRPTTTQTLEEWEAEHGKEKPFVKKIREQWEETHDEPFFSPFPVKDWEEIPTPKGELHRRICQELNDTYKRKNADYGDSFAMVRDLYPDMAIMVRIYDKVNRLRTLLNGKQAEVDESIDDSLVDLANYCIMELMERRVDKAVVVERGKVVGQNNQSRTIFDPEP